MVKLIRVASVAALLLAISLSANSTPAVAALNHAAIEQTFSVGSGCDPVTDIAVVESSGIVYVGCQDSGRRVIKKFDLNGNPVDFTADVPYVEGNELVDTPSTPQGEIGISFAVDNSDANNGYIFSVAGGGFNGAGMVDIFKPSGEWATSFGHPGNLGVGYAAEFSDVDVGPDGSIYTSQGGLYIPHVTKYNTAFQEVQRLYNLPDGARYLRVDSTGAVWVRQVASVRKYERDQFTSDLSIDKGARINGPLLASIQADTSPFADDPLVEGGNRFDVDLVNDDLYLDQGTHIDTYSAGTADELSHRNAPPFGLGTLVDSNAIAVTVDRHVFASTAGGSIVRFGPGDIVPDIRTPQPSIDDVGHTTALLTARVELAGGGSIVQCQIQYGKDTTYSGPDSGAVPCAPDPAGAPPGSNFESDTDVSAALSGLTTGATYHYRFKASNANGENAGIDRTVVPAFVLKVKTLAAGEVTEHGAVLGGTLDPDGLDTSYRFEYGVGEDYGLSTPPVDQGDSPGMVVVSDTLDDLPAGRSFHYRIVASNENGTTYGADRVFRTASVPDLSGVRASEVSATSAQLQARVDPLGYPTQYRFEYGTTPEYGHSAPATGEEAIGSGPEAVDVSQRVEGLQPGVTYHFRIVATNKWGSSASSDTTFDFAPPSCPNDHVRQLTGSSYLPDCRAYELVSPGLAGSVQLYPSQAVWDLSQSQDLYGAGDNWALNTGLANSPSRLAFFAGRGAIPGLDAPNSELDMYMATRTTGGWTTTLPGLTGSQVIASGGRRQCSESLELCIDHDEGVGLEIKAPETAPYLFSSAGEFRGRLPTNLKVVPGGERFIGAQRASADFSHYLFSSTNVAFAPGGLTGGQGSAYDNDLEARSVTVISKLPNGADIAQDGTVFHAIEFPGLSPDGSHVLMQTPAANGQSHLYMRVNQSVTYDVARGAGVKLVGMPREGSKVFFVADQRLTLDDTDDSADLYMWSEEGDALTRVSQGNGQGNSNSCNAKWIGGCGVGALTTERGHPSGLQSIPGLDDVIAEEEGDVYFYSPELLDPGSPAIANQRNLYVFRGGAVQLVASLDSGTQIDRMQISPDGRYAGIVTRSRLTSYDNRGFQQMYTYDADTGAIRCASCNPEALPPTSDVEASQGGPFMADDGRVFFATKERLVARDRDGRIIDVYEYVGGRPQLITSGVGSRDFTGGGALVEFGSVTEHTGLEAVSADGADVYFSTFDTLVPQDQNGPYVKFYDARTGGGFAAEPGFAPCTAADECHGADSSPPQAPLMASGGALGAGGNVPPARAKKKKHRQKPKHRRGKRHASRHLREGKHG